MRLQFALIGPALAAALGLFAPAAGLAAAARPPVPLPPPPAVYGPADWKPIDPANLLVIDTTKGRIVVEMIPVFAPDHVERLKTLTRQGYYDGLKFFRVIDDFMAQTGDKANTGAGNSDLPALKGQFNFRRGPDLPFSGARNARGGEFGFVGSVPVASQPDDLMALTADGKVQTIGLFCPGVAGMARTNEPDTAQTQFFLMRQGNPALNNQYTPWGKVVVGLDVVRALAVGEPPANPDSMTRVRIASDLPPADRPNVWRIDTTSAAFRGHMAAVALAEQESFSPCDIDVPSELRK